MNDHDANKMKKSIRINDHDTYSNSIWVPDVLHEMALCFWLLTAFLVIYIYHCVSWSYVNIAYLMETKSYQKLSAKAAVIFFISFS